MGLLVFTIPDKLFESRKKAWLSKCGVFALALVCWLSVNSGAVAGLFRQTVVEIPVDAASDQTVITQQEQRTPPKEYFEEGSSNIRIERTILNMSDPTAKVEINEYMVACYGTTEYPEDMTCITLQCKKGSEAETIAYEYKCREAAMDDADEVSAVITAIDTKVSMSADGEGVKGYIREGYAFSPMFTLGYTKTMADKEVFTTWLNLEKAN